MVRFSLVNDDILEDCLERIRHNATIEDCLRAYPMLSQDLEPLLILALQAHELPLPQLRPEVRTRIRKQLRQTVRGRSRQSAPRPWHTSPVFRLAFAFAAAFFALGSGLAAAQTSLPNSPLYGVKRTTEDVRLQLTSDPAAQAALHLEYSQTRFHEIVALSKAGDPIPTHVLADCAQQSDLAWRSITLLDPNQAVPLYQRYRDITDQRIAELSSGILAQSAESQPELQRFLEHEQSAKLTVQQQLPDAADEQAQPAATTLPDATRVLPQPTPAPAQGQPDANPVVTAPPLPSPNPDAPTPQPTADIPSSGEGNGDPASPTAQPDTSEPDDQGNPTPAPGNETPGDGNSANPTAQPDTPKSDDQGRPTPKPKDENPGGNDNHEEATAEPGNAKPDKPAHPTPKPKADTPGHSDGNTSSPNDDEDSNEDKQP